MLHRLAGSPVRERGGAAARGRRIRHTPTPDGRSSETIDRRPAANWVPAVEIGNADESA